MKGANKLQEKGTKRGEKMGTCSIRHLQISSHIRGSQ